MSGTKTREVQLSTQVASVLGARAEELFYIIKDIIDDRNIADELSGGFVLTGGGALMVVWENWGEYVLNHPTKVGYPQAFGGMTNIMQNPKYSTVLGLLLESGKRFQKDNHVFSNERVDIVKKLNESIKSVFKELF